MGGRGGARHNSEERRRGGEGGVTCALTSGVAMPRLCAALSHLELAIKLNPTTKRNENHTEVWAKISKVAFEW